MAGFVTIECVDCSNGAGYCNFHATFLLCYIQNNDTQSIKVLLRNCSNSSNAAYLFVYKSYGLSEIENLLIDIELPSNIQNLYIYNFQVHIRLTTFRQNTALTRIYIDSHIELESNSFFNNFTGLKYIDVLYVLSREPPSFSNLQSLNYLKMSLEGPITYTLDGTMLGGITNLVTLDLANSYFNGVTKGAFLNLIKLTSLNLGNNGLTYIEEGALAELSNLRLLYLNDNEKLIVSDSVFEGLTDLTSLDLDNTPGVPLNALIHTRNLHSLYLRYNGYHTLEPYVFQQMKSLKYLYLSDPFVCDCNLQWTSLLIQYGVYIRSPVCSDIFQKVISITNEELYINCSQTESFLCLNKSITCPGNEVCHNTEDSYVCGCPIGYALSNSSQCADIDECEEATNCQHACQNTEGSFHCECNEGYKLADDGYSCDDINECHVSNGGCELGCRNTIGSYQCFCYYGHELKNKTHCDNEIQYIVVQGIENEDYRFACYADHNLTVTNFTCENIHQNITGTTMSTTSTTGTTTTTGTTATTTATATSDCPMGYVQRYSGECIDEDECDFYTNCQHFCVNTEGSFHCECNEGYKLADDGYSCDDINECHVLNGGCEFGCRNTNGSHQCYCYYGYELKNETHCANEIQCIVVQNFENEDYRFTCHGDYNLTISNFTCDSIPKSSIATTSSTTTPTSDCPMGYVQRYSGECIDEDECDFYTNCQHFCVNTEGSFHCECNEGYKLADDGYSCDDINECHVLNGGCEFGCRNTNGSHQCYCYYGYELKNETHCDNEIQCIVVQNIENEDYRFTCLGNYNLTLIDFTCENISETSTTTFMSTTSTPIPTKASTTTESTFSIGYEIQCNVLVMQNIAGQGNHFICREGFNITINNLTDNSTDHTTVQTNEKPSTATTSEQIQESTIILFSILIIIIGTQTVIIILILICSLKMIKTARNPYIHRNMRQSHFQENNVEIPLEDMIEKQSNIPPNTIIQNPENPEVTSTHENVK